MVFLAGVATGILLCVGATIAWILWVIADGIDAAEEMGSL